MSGAAVKYYTIYGRQYRADTMITAGNGASMTLAEYQAQVKRLKDLAFAAVSKLKGVRGADRELPDSIANREDYANADANLNEFYTEHDRHVADLRRRHGYARRKAADARPSPS